MTRDMQGPIVRSQPSGEDIERGSRLLKEEASKLFSPGFDTSPVEGEYPDLPPSRLYSLWAACLTFLDLSPTRSRQAGDVKNHIPTIAYCALNCRPR